MLPWRDGACHALDGKPGSGRDPDSRVRFPLALSAKPGIVRISGFSTCVVSQLSLCWRLLISAAHAKTGVAGRQSARPAACFLLQAKALRMT
jgi:hypothetical protein